MIQFLSEVGGVSRKYIKDLSIQDKRSFFSLDKNYIEGFSDRFIGLETDKGHQIRVNIEYNKANSTGKVKGRKRNFQRNRGSRKVGRKNRFKGR